MKLNQLKRLHQHGDTADGAGGIIPRKTCPLEKQHQNMKLPMKMMKARNSGHFIHIATVVDSPFTLDSMNPRARRMFLTIAKVY
jgi:hypothetical protein